MNLKTVTTSSSSRPTNQPGDFQLNCSVIEASYKYFQIQPTCKPRALSQQQFASSQDWEHEASATSNDNALQRHHCNKFLDRLSRLAQNPSLDNNQK
jgi:hypothetical protein